MKARFFGLFLAFALLFGSAAAMAAPGKIVFCEGIEGQNTPIKPGTEFTGPAVCWVATSNEKFGKPALLATLYKDSEGGGQTIVSRQKIDVNPEWDCFIMKNAPAPEVGKYSLSLTSENGDVFAEGGFSIVAVDKSRKAEPVQTGGMTLKDLFNKYSNSAKKENE